MTKYLVRLLLIFLACGSLGCVHIITNKDEIFDKAKPDPIRFEDPICLKVNFLSEKLELSGNSAGISEMSEEIVSQIKVGLPYYNIALNCATPKASFTVIYRPIDRRNILSSAGWGIATVLSFGLIPSSSKVDGTIEVHENEKILAKTVYRQERFMWALAFPIWFYDHIKSAKKYHVTTDTAAESRFFAKAIREAMRKRNLEKVNLK